jgi:hypothetical protein
VLVSEDIRSLSEIKAGIIYFTTNPNECKPVESDESDSDRNEFFHLTFLKGTV